MGAAVFWQADRRVGGQALQQAEGHGLGIFRFRVRVLVGAAAHRRLTAGFAARRCRRLEMKATPDSRRDRLRAQLFFVVTVPACATPPAGVTPCWHPRCAERL